MDATGMWQMRDKQQPALHARHWETCKRLGSSVVELAGSVSLRGCVVEMLAM